MSVLRQSRSKPICEQIPLIISANCHCPNFSIGLGVLLGADNPSPRAAEFSKDLAISCTLVLEALRALATPLILLAVVHDFMQNTEAVKKTLDPWGLLQDSVPDAVLKPLTLFLQACFYLTRVKYGS